MFITWPDMWYHSSEDTPDKQDSTQYKRAAVVGTGALAVLASGTDEMAARVLNDNLGRGLSRMGESHTKGLGYMADATPQTLSQAYKEARVAILHQAGVEKGVVKSAGVLWTTPLKDRSGRPRSSPLIDQRASALLNEVRAAYQLQAMQRGTQAAEPAMTAEEKEAANLIVQSVGRRRRGTRRCAGAGGGRGGGAGAAGGRWRRVPPHKLPPAAGRGGGGGRGGGAAGGPKPAAGSERGGSASCSART
jgi:hypothetical protein